MLSPKITRKVILPKQSPSIYLDLSIISQGRYLCGQGSTILPEISCICYTFCYSKCCFSIFILFSFGFALSIVYGRFFLLHTVMHIYRVRNETFCFSHGDCVMHRVTQLGSCWCYLYLKIQNLDWMVTCLNPGRGGGGGGHSGIYSYYMSNIEAFFWQTYKKKCKFGRGSGPFSLIITFFSLSLSLGEVPT